MQREENNAARLWIGHEESGTVAPPRKNGKDSVPFFTTTHTATKNHIQKDVVADPSLSHSPILLLLGHMH